MAVHLLAVRLGGLFHDLQLRRRETRNTQKPIPGRNGGVQTTTARRAVLPGPIGCPRTRLTQLWRVPLGPSYSGPIVAEDLVFTTETKNKETEIVYALDRKTGKERWRAEWQHTFEAVGEGTLMRDAVRYALPLGFLGHLAQRCFVRSDLDSIFDYRARKVAALLGFEFDSCLK